MYFQLIIVLVTAAVVSLAGCLGFGKAGFDLIGYGGYGHGLNYGHARDSYGCDYEHPVGPSLREQKVNQDIMDSAKIMYLATEKIWTLTCLRPQF